MLTIFEDTIIQDKSSESLPSISLLIFCRSQRIDAAAVECVGSSREKSILSGLVRASGILGVSSNMLLRCWWKARPRPGGPPLPPLNTGISAPRTAQFSNCLTTNWPYSHFTMAVYLLMQIIYKQYFAKLFIFRLSAWEPLQSKVLAARYTDKQAKYSLFANMDIDKASSEAQRQTGFVLAQRECTISKPITFKGPGVYEWYKTVLLAVFFLL